MGLFFVYSVDTNSEEGCWMKRNTFAITCTLLALCALLTTAVFAVQEREWFLPSGDGYADAVSV